MGTFSLASFYIYVGNSSFVITEHFGLSPAIYSILFAANAIPYVAVSQVSARLTRSYHPRSIVRAVATAQLALICVMLAAFVAGLDQLIWLQLGLMAFFAFMGASLPILFVMTLHNHPKVAGSASALMGALNFVGGAVSMGVVARFFDGTAVPMLQGTAVCALIVFGLSRLLPKSGTSV